MGLDPSLQGYAWVSGSNGGQFSNIVERAIRPQAITRKNALFAGSDGGGRTWATIASLLQTARMNDVDPFAWLKLTLERLANGWPNSRIEELMPWSYKAD